MIGGELTTEDDLRKIATKLHVPLLYTGFRDRIPRPPRPGAYIINMQSSDKRGTHWVGLYLSNNPKRAFYYDSFGGPPPSEVEQIMKRWSPSRYSNPYTIQNIDYGYCGQYVIDFLHHIMHNPTKNGFEHFLSKYHKLFRLQPKTDSKI